MTHRLRGGKRKGTAKAGQREDQEEERKKCRTPDIKERESGGSAALENRRVRVERGKEGFLSAEEWLLSAGGEKRMTSAYDTRISARQ